MAINKKIDELVSEFAKCSEWEEKYTKLIKLGKSLEPLSDENRLEKFKVKGCQSQVWLVPSFNEGRVHFFADSDSVLVKGIIAILLKVYSGATPGEILDNKPDFLDVIGIRDHLSMNRSNGLASMIKQIQMYALVYKSMESSNADQTS